MNNEAKTWREKPTLKRYIAAGLVSAGLINLVTIAGESTDLLGSRPTALTLDEQRSIAQQKFIRAYNSTNTTGRFKMLLVDGFTANVPTTHRDGTLFHSFDYLQDSGRDIHLGNTCLRYALQYEVDKPVTLLDPSLHDVVIINANPNIQEISYTWPATLEIEGLRAIINGHLDMSEIRFSNTETADAMAELNCLPRSGDFISPNGPPLTMA